MVENGVEDPWGAAVDIRLDDLEFIEEPKDHKAPANPRKPRTASKRGSARGASKSAAPASSDVTTLRPKSIAAS
jgi:hypothetical protein